MEIFLSFLIIAILLDLEEKLKRMKEKKKERPIDLNNYRNKEVYIVLDDDNVTDSYLFTTMMKTIGKVIECDETWFLFRYYNKNERKTITQYLKISDLKSINEIK